MAEEQKGKTRQVKAEEEEKDTKDQAQALDKDTAYEKQALDKTGRDWSKRKTFKPNGTV
ncbi:MAG: hypothetical protein LBL86_12510 [Coriobacteriales bacterium]|jgi:hypothetical protein|nr:hypothetical protein [Coriobacteriales bacterium]